MCAVRLPHRIETDRLTLRSPRREDAAWIARQSADYDIARMSTRIPHPYGLADAEAFIEGLSPSDRVFLIEHKRRGPVGVIGFHDGTTAWSESGCALSPEVGYWLARPHWGDGLASEALQGALVWASEEWGIRAAAAGHFADNPASARVLEKAGFLYTGEVQPRFSRARNAVAPTRMMVWLA
jgi:RimJ/RimL family protein N-acetyltransferase